MIKVKNAVEELKIVYNDGRTFWGPRDVFTFLTLEGYPMSYVTATRMDTEARNQLAAEGHAIQDPTRQNNWTRTGLATTLDIEKSRQRAIRYIKTFTRNLANKLNVDAHQHDASAKAIQNDALIQKANEFLQALADFDNKPNE